MKQLLLKRNTQLITGLFLLLITSCTSVRLISDYDEITDKAVTAFQEKVTKFLVKVEDEVGTDKALYENYKTFYQEVKVDLNTLKIRADAIDKNKIVQSQVAELTTMVINMEKLHKLGFFDVSQVTALQQPFNSAFTAIIKLQMGLKRGDKNNK